MTAEEVSNNTSTGSGVNYNTISKIPVELGIQVGKAKITVKDLMELKEGDVVALHTSISDPFEIYANGAKVAEGKMVESDNEYYIKVTKLAGDNNG